MTDTPQETPAKAEKSPGWKGFEEAVAAIQALFTPGAKVTHDERVTDRKGHRRQFDVVIRDKWGALDILGVIECKDWNAKVDLDVIDAFHTKSREVRSNVSVIVSRSGFTKRALEAAKEFGIGTLSLLPGKELDVGFRVGFQSYAEVFLWTQIRMQLFFTGKKGMREQFDTRSVTYKGMPLINWFARELVTTHRDRAEAGWMEVTVEFQKPRRISIAHKIRTVKAIRFSALREMQKKTRFLGITGEAFYDWQTKKLMWPNKGAILTDVMRTDFSDWEDYNGEIPKLEDREGFAMHFRVMPITFDPKTPVVDLSKL